MNPSHILINTGIMVVALAIPVIYAAHNLHVSKKKLTASTFKQIKNDIESVEEDLGRLQHRLQRIEDRLELQPNPVPRDWEISAFRRDVDAVGRRLAWVESTAEYGATWALR